MIEDIAPASGRDVSRETFAKLKHYAFLLEQENQIQNLIARSTIAELWSRHLIDSAQLLRFIRPGQSVLDVGSGGGLPGMVLAILSNQPITLVEPRKLRSDFLRRTAGALSLAHVDVCCAKAERVSGCYDVVTARAVASVDRIFEATTHLASHHTRWILPKGRSGAIELAEAAQAWQGHFRTERSITDPESVIVVAEGVRRRGGASR